MIKKICLLGLLTLPLFLLGCEHESVQPDPPLGLYINVKFTNNSGITADQIHVVISGKNESGQEGFFDLTADPIKYVATTNVAAVPDVTLDHIIARHGLRVPYIQSGRIYLAIDQQVGAERSDYNQHTVAAADAVIYDKIELSVEDTGNVVNLTQVDYFAMPIKITCGNDIRGFNDGITREEIINEYSMFVNGDWLDLVLVDINGKRLRILNPAKIIPTDITYFSELLDYYDNIIDAYWANGSTVTVLDNEDSSLKTGTADGSEIDFGADGAYVKPSSLDMFGQAAKNGSNAKIVKWLSCAINRGVIDNPNVQDQGDSSKFYSASQAYNNGKYNYYAEFFHNPKYTVGGRAYALAFDDVFGEDSALTVPNKGTVTIQLQPFDSPY